MLKWFISFGALNISFEIRNCTDPNYKLERIFSAPLMPLLKRNITFLRPHQLHAPQQPTAERARHRFCMADHARPDVPRLGPRDQIILALWRKKSHPPLHARALAAQLPYSARPAGGQGARARSQ